MIPADSRGSARFTLPVPNISGLVGKKLNWQWFCFDPGANRFNLTASEGAETKIGAR